MRTSSYVATTVAATALTMAGVPMLGAVAGLALAFVLPGHALVGAVFARLALSRVERIVLTPALSLAVLVLGGLLLDIAQIRLTLGAWSLITGTVTVIAALVGHRRSDPVRSFDRSTTMRWVVPAMIGALLLTSAGWISLRSATAQRDAVAVTGLSMVLVNPAGTDPTRILAIDVTAIHSPRSAYRLVINGPDAFRMTVTPDVGPDGAWRRDIAVPSDGRVTADLYRAGDATPYRSVFVDLS
jgi:uncharacterized protein DUF1616